MNPTRQTLALTITLLALVGSGAPSRIASAKPDATTQHRSLKDAPAFVAETNTWMTDALERFEVVPGIAVAVVVEDQAVLVQGWGTADIEHDLPATDETVYYIASSTKSFTGLAAALLDARGTIDLDSSLSDHTHGTTIPGELKPDEVKLRDLLTHTSGIDNGPIAGRLAFTGDHDEQTLWRLLEQSTPAEEAPLGTFKYANVGYNIYGMILDRETGKPWQDVLRDEIFQPLGLERTTAYASLPREKGWPMAAPYFGLYPDGIKRTYLEKQDNTMQSAGGMMTTARDLARWLEFQLNDGAIDGHQIIDAEIVRSTHEPTVEADGGRPPFGTHHYGLGWSHGTYHDTPVLHHSGGFAGFRTLVSFAPDTRIGVAVVVNEGSIGGRFADVVGEWAYEWWMGTPEADRVGPTKVDELVAMREQLQPRFAAQLEKHAAREWMLSRPLGVYTGTFSNDLWGTVEITEHDGRLAVRSGNLHCVTTAYEKPETARIELVPGSGSVIVFEPDEGDVTQVRVDGDVYTRLR